MKIAICEVALCKCMHLHYDWYIKLSSVQWEYIPLSLLGDDLLETLIPSTENMCDFNAYSHILYIHEKLPADVL